ncbi:hypothetical protein, partial [Mycobacterium ulcerans]
SIVLQIARAYTAAPIARHQRSSTQLTSLLINNAGALAAHTSTPGPLGARWRWLRASGSGND